MQLEVSRRPSARLVCAACKGPAEGACWRCGACATVLHPDCRSTLPRCPTLGCRGEVPATPAPSATLSPPTPPAPGRRSPAAWPRVAFAAFVLVGGLALDGLKGPRWRGYSAASASHREAQERSRTAPAEPTVACDLSHVLPGQRWVFRGRAAGSELEITYEVLAVGPRGVRYRASTRLALGPDGALQSVGQPVETDWLPAGAPAWAAAPPVRLQAGGQDWECLVNQTEGARTWIPLRGGAPTFPPFLRSEDASLQLALSELVPPAR